MSASGNNALRRLLRRSRERLRRPETGKLEGNQTAKSRSWIDRAHRVCITNTRGFAYFLADHPIDDLVPTRLISISRVSRPNSWSSGQTISTPRHALASLTQWHSGLERGFCGPPLGLSSVRLKARSNSVPATTRFQRTLSQYCEGTGPDAGRRFRAVIKPQLSLSRSVHSAPHSHHRRC
jgi:hypothetical protein